MALIKCAECGREVSDKAASCPHCGAPVAAASGTTTSKDEKVATGDKKTTQNGCAGCLGCLGVIVIIAFVSSLFSDSSAPSSEPRARDNSTMAVVQCQNFVRDRLRAPSTADFPFLDHETQTIGTNHYAVTSYVDAQNAFGAEIRNNWRCEVRFTGGESADQRNWSLIDLQMN